MQQLQYFHFYHHQNKDFHSLELSRLQNTVVWETCLRKIIFYDSSEDVQGLEKNSESIHKKEIEAIHFLIEVLCGLQSRVMGETEIFGQFRKFIETDDAKKVSFLNNPKFVQFIFQQVKEIREKYLSGMAVNSYGSLIRKKCSNQDRIHILGYGQLAQEIIPWLKNKKVNVYVRNHQRFQNTEKITFHNFNSVNRAQLADQVMILAAPVETAGLQASFNSKGIGQIIDCRALNQAQSSLKLLNLAKDVVELNDLFHLLEGEKEKFKNILPAVTQDIALRAQNYFYKAQHRPLGWDDLCG